MGIVGDWKCRCSMGIVGLLEVSGKCGGNCSISVGIMGGKCSSSVGIVGGREV